MFACIDGFGPRRGCIVSFVHRPRDPIAKCASALRLTCVRRNLDTREDCARHGVIIIIIRRRFHELRRRLKSTLHVRCARIEVQRRTRLRRGGGESRAKIASETAFSSRVLPVVDSLSVYPSAWRESLQLQAAVRNSPVQAPNAYSLRKDARSTRKREIDTITTR